MINPLPPIANPEECTYCVWSEVDNIWKYVNKEDLYAGIKTRMEDDGIVFPVDPTP